MKKKYKILICLLLILFGLNYLDSQTRKRPAKILKNTGITPQKIDVLNSKYLETNLSITPDGKYLFFMSENPSSWSTKNYAGTGTYDGDIWYSKKVNDKWLKPVNLGRTINTPQGEDEPNVSPDGQTVYFQSWRTDWQKTGGPYYKAELSGSNWKNIIGLNSGITEFFKDQGGVGLATDGATFSPDGKKFVISFGKDYNSDMDLFLSKKDSKGKWSKFTKLSISTPNNDRCPFLAADGKTLYFASNGYDGFGKLDIFKTTLNDDGTFGEVVNIGEPFNTKSDDYGFVLTASGDECYFVRNGDIYYADLKKTSEEIKPIPTVILSGIITDSVTGKPTEALVKVLDRSNNQEIGSSRSNAVTGEYSVVLPTGKKYIQTADKKNYYNFQNSFSINDEPGFKELKQNIKMVPIGSRSQPVVDITPPPKDTAKVIVKETPPVVKDTPVINPPVKIIEQIDESCFDKLYNHQNFCIGLTGSIPLSYGLKGEYIYRNIGLALAGLHFPNIGELDETKPAEEFKSDNYSNLVLLALIYHIPIDCKFYPFVGLYGGLQFRNWKKDIGYNKVDVQSGSYTAKHFGIALGLKYFLTNDFFLEGSLGLGRNSVHSQPSGELTKWEFQALGWFAICYNFDLTK